MSVIKYIDIPFPSLLLFPLIEDELLSLGVNLASFLPVYSDERGEYSSFEAAKVPSVSFLRFPRYGNSDESPCFPSFCLRRATMVDLYSLSFFSATAFTADCFPTLLGFFLPILFSVRADVWLILWLLSIETCAVFVGCVGLSLDTSCFEADLRRSNFLLLCLSVTGV